MGNLGHIPNTKKLNAKEKNIKNRLKICINTFRVKQKTDGSGF